MLPPVADVALFGDELGRVAAVGLEEVDSSCHLVSQSSSWVIAIAISIT